ncbi:tail fiber protein [Colwellia sp. PAMC 21821]|uniref:phage tail protein n=1 Tax=Colwellia sp. PAMC 21821 TaxID=1816219 RepID=UPI001E5C7214|nr:tail fiber protein [Colwellia sp. PAMC 21821]
MKTLKLIKLSCILGLTFTAISIPMKASACSSQPFLGGMCAFGGNFAIRSWAKAEGQLLAISSNTALFSLLGTTYGGDGRTTFGLPDLRGRSPIGQGRGPGLNDYRLGQRGGAETHTLNVLQMPVHNHTATTTTANVVDTSATTIALRALSARSSTNIPTDAVLANSPNRENIYNSGAPNVDMSADSIAFNLSVDVNSTSGTVVNNNGSSQAFSIRGPYLSLTWLIALQGIFPSRS